MQTRHAEPCIMKTGTKSGPFATKHLWNLQGSPHGSWGFLETGGDIVSWDKALGIDSSWPVFSGVRSTNCMVRPPAFPTVSI